MFAKIFGLKRQQPGLRITDGYFIVAGLAAFTTIAFWTITKSSVWFDEAFGAYMIRFNFADIARYTAADVHPPLYYWLLKLWSMLFGSTELGLRSMSVFFGAIAILFGYLLIHRLFDKKTARISLIFMVLSPMLVRYSQEMRMYTLVAAIALAATYVLTFAAESKKRKPWIIYGILVGLGMWVHYFMALVWIAHWIWRADMVRQTVSKAKFIKTFFSKNWILSHIIAVGIFTPWLPFLLFQALVIQVYGFWIPAVTPETLANFYTNVLFYQLSSETASWLAVGFFAIIASLAWLAIRVYKSLNDKQRKSYSLVIILAFAPVVLLLMMSLPPLRSTFVDRYLIPSILFTYIFIGVTLSLGLRLIKPIARYFVSAAIILCMLIGVVNVWHYGNYAKTANPPASNNARDIVQAVITKSGDNQPIIANSPWLFYEAVFYSTDKHPIYFIDAETQYKYGSLDMLKYNDDHKIKDLKAFTKINQIVWYVGLPRGGSFSAPYSNWKQLQKVIFKDSINGKPAYEAIQYQITQ